MLRSAPVTDQIKLVQKVLKMVQSDRFKPVTPVTNRLNQRIHKSEY